MKNMVYIMLLVSSLTLYGQKADDPYQVAMDAFMEHYNAKNYQAIFELFDDSMKTAVPYSSLEQQLEGLNSQIGLIKNVSFIEAKNKGKIFKVDHEVMPLEYIIHLNDSNKMIGLRPQPYTNRDVKVIERNTTDMILPFRETWFVFWGGTDVSKNYHVAHVNQKYAYDIMMVEDGLSYKGDPKKNENYYVFGKDIIAPCDGKIVQVIQGVHDNIPGELNPAQLTGNTVVIETKAKEYILFAHLKQGTIVVKEGQNVKQGELLGKCGNSGNSTEAHLHLSLQNTVNMLGATGGKLFFKNILVNGELKEDYLPEKGDQIRNIEN